MMAWPNKGQMPTMDKPALHLRPARRPEPLDEGDPIAAKKKTTQAAIKLALMKKLRGGR